MSKAPEIFKERDKSVKRLNDGVLIYIVHLQNGQVKGNELYHHVQQQLYKRKISVLLFAEYMAIKFDRTTCAQNALTSRSLSLCG